MLLLLFFSFFVEDTVYVRSYFPYTEELKYSFPSFSHGFYLPNGTESILSETSSILFKDYGNLSSISIRGTRTQDIDIVLNGIPLKTAQNDYADLSFLPMSLSYKGIIVKHPLSSYGNVESPGGGVFLNLNTDFNGGITLFTDKTMEVIISPIIKKKNNVVISLSQKKAHSLTDFSKFFSLFSGPGFSFLFTTRRASVPGPIGTNIKGEKDEIFTGYALSLLDNRSVNVSIKGNISYLQYRQKSTVDIHRSFYNKIKVQSGMFGVSFTTEYLTSTKTQNIERRTVALMMKKGIFYESFSLAIRASSFYLDEFKKWAESFFVGVSGNLRGIMFYSNFSKGIHFPSFFDLYWPEDAFARGNPELMPEDVLQYEGGLKYLRKHTLFNLTFYHKEIANMIQWLPVSGKYSPYNTGTHKISGIEARVEYHGEGVRAGFKSSLGLFDEILYYPKVEEGFYLTVGGLNLNVSYIGRRLKRPASIKFFEPIELIDISYEKIINKMMGFKVGVRNLLDEDVEWITGYPQQNKRIFYTTIKIKWR